MRPGRRGQASSGAAAGLTPTAEARPKVFEEGRATSGAAPTRAPFHSRRSTAAVERGRAVFNGPRREGLPHQARSARDVGNRARTPREVEGARALDSSPRAEPRAGRHAAPADGFAKGVLGRGIGKAPLARGSEAREIPIMTLFPISTRFALGRKPSDARTDVLAVQSSAVTQSYSRRRRRVPSDSHTRTSRFSASGG